MTVMELLEHLAREAPEAEVYFADDFTYDTLWLVRVEGLVAVHEGDEKRVILGDRVSVEHHAKR